MYICSFTYYGSTVYEFGVDGVVGWDAELRGET